MIPSVLSRRVLTDVFGVDFVSFLEAGVNIVSEGNVVNIMYPSTGSDQVDVVALENIPNLEQELSKDLVHASPAKSHLVSSVHHTTTTTDDGPSKPNKTPRRTADSPTDIMDFEDTSFKKEAPDLYKTSTFLDNLAQEMKRLLNILEETERRQLDTVHQEGRLGPGVVKYDVGSHVGSFIISNDRLGVNSQCNFGSVRACSCVYKGKWQYEIQLGSNGVMQVGWATLETKFSQEKGVGDTQDSFAYDGNRLRKWNKSTAQYGETWQAGDIIGCCIDLDEGKIEFLRNGKSLGVAFNSIRIGPAVAYFPAISLAYQENIVANFGATPLQFPLRGYSPMQSERTADNTKSSLLLSWLDKVLPLYRNSQFSDFGMTNNPLNFEHRTLLIITNRIMEFLGPHLHSGFVVEQSFFPFFAKTLGLPEKVSHHDKINTTDLSYERTDLLLDIMWTLLEDSEMKSCLERMCVVLMNQFRSNSLSLSYPFQHYSLQCLLALSNHRKTRRYLIRNLLFDRTSRLMQFLHVRPMDETVLKEIIPETWWPGKSSETSSSALSYQKVCNTIQEHVAQIQRLQVMFLKSLLTNDDGTDKRPSSRALFLRKFRAHVRDVIRPGSVLHQPVSKAMCTFFTFLRTVAELYSEEIEPNNNYNLPSLPSSLFYDTSVSYFDMERVGGLASYLYKAHHFEVSKKLSIPDYSTNVGTATTQHREPPGTPMPGVIHVSTSIATEGDHHRAGVSISAPAITIALPRMHPLLGNVNNAVGSPATVATSMSTDHATTAQARNNIMAPPQLLETSDPSSANDDNVSSTSSGETIVTTPAPAPHFGALITGTPSGHNAMLPMLTDFRSLIADQGFTFYPGGFLGFANFEHRSGVQPQNPAVVLLGKDFGSMDALFSLRELLDDAIIIFTAGVQSNVEKVVTMIGGHNDYKAALAKAEDNLKSAKTEAERLEVVKSIEIFTKKLDEQGRNLAWIQSAVFTLERQQFVYQLMTTILKTLKEASLTPLFSFVPEHYVSSLINLNWLILTQMHPTVPYTNVSGLETVLCEIAEFVATHFSDPRIVIAETKDTLTQALSTFICNETMLRALEQMPSESQLTMIKAILRPYENRAWAQSNWMLVRMWQGDGFGFQYPNSLEARRSYRAKPVQDEFGISTNLPPTPSKILQSHVASVLMSDQKFAASYIHSVLNQLNWALSEFVGLLQEIQTAANRPERVFIESRQLKICCTCFELTQALLRVMEMIVSIASPVLTDFTRDSAEPLLSRLCMLLSQVLNRIGSNTGCFSSIIELDIAGLENVTHFPILSAVAGILVGMIKGELSKTTEEEISSTKTLLGEPSFQVNSLDFFTGRNQSNVPEGRRVFSLRNHAPDDVSEVEMTDLENVMGHLNSWAERLEIEAELIDDDLVCTICYAYPQNATLKPCNHRTCKSCILHHLMNRGECFFCKAVIQQVFLDDGTKIHDINTPTSEPQADSPVSGRHPRS